MFTIGQKVVCVDPTPSGSIKKNEIYTISWCGEYHGHLAVELKEAEPSYPSIVNLPESPSVKILMCWVDEMLARITEDEDVLTI